MEQALLGFGLGLGMIAIGALIGPIASMGLAVLAYELSHSARVEPFVSVSSNHELVGGTLVF